MGKTKLGKQQDNAGESASGTEELATEKVDKSKGGHDIISEKGKLKLSLAVQLVTKASLRYNPESYGNDRAYHLNDPAYDDLYRNALDRADWLIREVQSQEGRDIYLYQFFSQDEVMQVKEVAKRFSDIGIKGFSLNSIKTLSGRVFEVLNRIDDVRQSRQVAKEQVAGFIKSKIAQIAKTVHLNEAKGISSIEQAHIAQELEKHLEEKTVELVEKSTTGRFTPKVWIMNIDVAAYFEDYCTASRPEDQTLSIRDGASKDTRFLRPYALFLCACILRDRNMLDESTAKKLCKAWAPDVDFKIRSSRRNHTLGLGSSPFHPKLFPEFNRDYEREFDISEPV